MGGDERVGIDFVLFVWILPMSCACELSMSLALLALPRICIVLPAPQPLSSQPDQPSVIPRHQRHLE